MDPKIEGILGRVERDYESKCVSFFYKRKDHREDTIIGILRDDDNAPVIRVDGPYSAPSEHFTNYGTVMMVGAGIGLTPWLQLLPRL